MAEYSSGEVAQRLGIAPITLRRWCLELAAWLTPAGTAPLGEVGERRYTDDDLWVLQHAAPPVADVEEASTAALEEIEPEPSIGEPSIVEAEVIEPEPRVPPDLAALLERMAELYKQLLANKEQEIAALRQALDATELAAAVERRELEMLTRITRILERENQRLGAELDTAQQQLGLLPARSTWRKRMSRWFSRGDSEAHSAPPDLSA